MNPRPLSRVLVAGLAVGVSAWWGVPALAQLIDRTQASNAAQEGIAKSLADQIGTGRGDVFTPNSSAFIIARDPFRAIRRGRQLFQRKFTRGQGQGPGVGDGGLGDPAGPGDLRRRRHSGGPAHLHQEFLGRPDPDLLVVLQGVAGVGRLHGQGRGRQW